MKTEVDATEDNVANHPEVEQLQVEQLQVVIVIVLSSWREALDEKEASKHSYSHFPSQGKGKALNKENRQTGTAKIWRKISNGAKAKKTMFLHEQ